MILQVCKCGYVLAQVSREGLSKARVPEVCPGCGARINPALFSVEVSPVGVSP